MHTVTATSLPFESPKTLRMQPSWPPPTGGQKYATGENLASHARAQRPQPGPPLAVAGPLLLPCGLRHAHRSRCAAHASLCTRQA